MNSPGNVYQCLTVLVRKVSSRIQPERLLFRFMPVVPHPVTTNHREECSCVLTVPSLHWGVAVKCPEVISVPGCTSSTLPALSSWGNYSSLVILVLFH